MSHATPLSCTFFTCLLNLNKLFFILFWLYYIPIINSVNLFYCLFLIIIFLIKIPWFLFHIWLPKAHIEAPISGSIILAGIILKLGGFGLFHILSFVLKFNIIFNFYFISLRLLGIFILRLVCFFRRDLKIVIAYSSVVHMDLLIIGFININNWVFVVL